MTKAKERADGLLSQLAISSDTTLVSSYRYLVDTSAARVLTLPASPDVGDEIQVIDATGGAGTNLITVSNNGLKIAGLTTTLLIDKANAAVALIYTGTTYGWKVA